jgi:hypothetical protein
MHWTVIQTANVIQHSSEIQHFPFRELVVCASIYLLFYCLPPEIIGARPEEAEEAYHS